MSINSQCLTHFRLEVRIARMLFKALVFACALLVSCQSQAPPTLSADKWIPLNQGLPSHAPVLSLAAAADGSVYAAAYDTGSVYRMEGAANSWVPDNDGLPSLPSYSLATVGNAILVGTAAGLYERGQDFNAWERVESVPAVAVYSISLAGDGTQFAGTDAAGVFTISGGGTAWARLPGLNGEIALSVLGINAKTVFVGTSGHGLFLTRDGGTTWDDITVFQNAFVPLLTLDPHRASTIYAGTRRALLRSLDGGITWQTLGGGIETQQVYALSFSPDGNRLLAGTAGHGIFSSTDEGTTWSNSSPAPPTEGERGLAVPEGHAVLSFLTARDTLFAGTTDGVIQSRDQGRTWSPPDFHAIKGIGSSLIHDLLFLPESKILWAATEDGLYSREGGSWIRFDAGSKDLPVLSIAASEVDPRIVYVGTSHEGVFRSDDAGKNWQSAGGDLGGRGSVSGLVIHPRNSQIVFARVLYERIYKSTDGGESWRTVWTGMSQATEIEAIAIDPKDPQKMYAGGNDQLFFSNDGGESWQGAGLQGVTTFSVWIDPRDSRRALMGTTDGLYETLDGGQAFARAGLAGETVTTIAGGKQGFIYAGTKYNGMFASADGGKTFSRFGSGLDAISIVAIAEDELEGIVFAAANGAVYCHRSLASTATLPADGDCR